MRWTDHVEHLQMRNIFEPWLVNLKGNDHLEGTSLVVNEMILKLTSEEPSG